MLLSDEIPHSITKYNTALLLCLLRIKLAKRRKRETASAGAKFTMMLPRRTGPESLEPSPDGSPVRVRLELRIWSLLPEPTMTVRQNVLHFGETFPRKRAKDSHLQSASLGPKLVESATAAGGQTGRLGQALSDGIKVDCPVKKYIVPQWECHFEPDGHAKSASVGIELCRNRGSKSVVEI